jgi:hypothetical protein
MSKPYRYNVGDKVVALEDVKKVPTTVMKRWKDSSGRHCYRLTGDPRLMYEKDIGVPKVKMVFTSAKELKSVIVEPSVSYERAKEIVRQHEENLAIKEVNDTASAFEKRLRYYLETKDLEDSDLPKEEPHDTITADLITDSGLDHNFGIKIIVQSSFGEQLELDLRADEWSHDAQTARVKELSAKLAETVGQVLLGNLPADYTYTPPPKKKKTR